MKKISFFIISFSLLTLSFSLFLFPVSAQSPTVPSGLVSNVNTALTTMGNPFKYQDIGCLVSNGLSWGLIAASILVLLYLVWGGIQWITSSGEKAGLESAKNKITAAIMGTAIVAATWAIFLIIHTTLGLPVGIGGTNCASTVAPVPGSTTPPSGTFDCCSIVGGNEVNPPACCRLAASVNCVTNRYLTSSTQCSQTTINRSCWASNMPPGVEGPNDPCRER